VKRDFYFKEAMNVTADYMTSLAGGAAGGLARSNKRPAVAPPQPVPVPVLQ
jgi:hypothetical protein